MSIITNDDLTRSGTGCVYSCATVSVKWLRSRPWRASADLTRGPVRRTTATLDDPSPSHVTDWSPVRRSRGPLPWRRPVNAACRRLQEPLVPSMQGFDASAIDFFRRNSLPQFIFVVCFVRLNATRGLCYARPSNTKRNETKSHSLYHDYEP